MTFEEICKIPLLSDINSSVLSKLYTEQQIFIRHYIKSATVHLQHEACSMLDVVLSGNLVAHSLWENGSAIKMFEFQKGSIIGANLLFGDEHTYPLNIYSVTSCELLHITQNAVMEFLHNYNFVMHYIKSLSMNSQGMNQKITMLTQNTLRGNLLDYLKKQSILQASSRIILPVSKKQLADYLGVQRPSLFRELKKLQNEKIIEINNRTITLHINSN
ncbi:MAG: Crp/Fnr family transcriptional regulator [Candidatus Fimivivens sp.]|nr:Crp/Fnr family transcriptional regulator [Candidatus Fimivivens sp.]